MTTSRRIETGAGLAPGLVPGLVPGLALGLAVAVAAAVTPVRAEGLLPYRDADAVSRGQEVYRDHCASCHGAALEGEPGWTERDADGYLPAPPHDETGHTWHHPDAQLFDLTKHGVEAVVGQGYRSRMIGFGDVLGDADILAVLAYIKSTWPSRVIDIHNRINAQSGG